MKLLAALAFSLLLAPSALAAEVDIKKGTAIVDGVEELTWKGCDLRIENSTCLVKSVKTGAVLFSVRHVYHDGWYNFDVTFFDFKEEARVKVVSLKEFVENLWALSVVTPAGAVDEANARRYARMYDTLPERKIIMIIEQ
jgi:hypothetical protein